MAEERYEVEDEFDTDEPLGVSLEDEDDSLSTQFKIDKPSIWQTIRRFFFRTSAEKQAENRTRVYILNQAIETYPDAAVNYLLRGELYLDFKEFDLVQKDFETALALAEAQYDNERWGLGSQAIQDRARRGLQRIQQ